MIAHRPCYQMLSERLRVFEIGANIGACETRRFLSIALRILGCHNRRTPWKRLRGGSLLVTWVVTVGPLVVPLLFELLVIILDPPGWALFLEEDLLLRVLQICANIGACETRGFLSIALRILGCHN